MFGRKKYEDENGDYIRPVEEYRDDCTEYHDHEQTYDDYDSRTSEREYRSDCYDYNEHGQTYRNYDTRTESKEYRKECSDHEHGQTYSDYDSRSSSKEYRRNYGDHDGSQSYDKQKNAAASNSVGIFERELMPGERLLWAGSTAKGAKLTEGNPLGCLMFIPVMMMLFCFNFIFGIVSIMTSQMYFVDGGVMPTIRPFGIVYMVALVAIIMIVCNMKVKTITHYAITDKRVMAYRGNRMSSTPIANIMTINVRKNKRNIGYVSYTVAYSQIGSAGSITTSTNTGIYGVADPNTPYRILKEAKKKLNEERK